MIDTTAITVKPPMAVESLCEQIVTGHAAYQAAAETAIGHAITCGRLLIELKAKLPHGSYIEFIETNFTFTRQTARRYTNIAIADDRGELQMEHAGSISVREALKQIAPPAVEVAVDDDVDDSEEGAVRDLVDDLGPLGAITALDLWFHNHHILATEEKLAEVDMVCEIAGVKPLIEDLRGTDSTIAYVWVGYVAVDMAALGAAETDAELAAAFANPITFHPGWADYCRSFLGENVRFATQQMMPYVGPRIEERI